MILVTGGTGLTGSHLLFELAKRGHAIRATKRSTSSVGFVRKVFLLYTQNPDDLLELIEWVDVDLLDYAALAEATVGVDTIYHSGAIVSFNPKDAQSISETNVRGTANVVDACIQNGVKTLCHISSIASLGEPNERGVVDENSIWTKTKGKSNYAKSKFFGEMEVWRGAEQGLRVIIVNPSVIIGPGRWNSGSGRLFSRISKGMPIYTHGVTGYIDVRDVAKAMVLLTNNHAIKNERFILNAQNLSFKEFFTDIALSLGKKPPRFEVKPWMTKLAYPAIKLFGALIGKGAVISRANLTSAFTITHYSSEKLKAQTGFTFTPIADSVRFVGEVFQKKFL
ncbi:MAG: NAD-dependent epimerase/dehydratase family protein [Bacteroidales bacterium]|nr:MAG: NAD-dependent epimerase/dehydratase family protein [Bacteroidales bacterium]